MNLFIDQAYLNKKSAIPSNVDWTLIEPLLEETQIMDILPLLGSNLYDELVTQSTPPTTLTAANKTLLDDYVIPCMVKYFLARATPMFKYRYTNKGVLEKNSDNSTAISSSDMKFLIDEHKNNAEELAQRLICYISIHSVDYPSYYISNTTTLIAPRNKGYDSPLYLE